ncbi:ORF056 RNA polymerase subunit RPO147 [Bovine papular stomatitis virus]|uniref:DNA-directed RNA polymerase 147 kDa polypeptide n=1 Tax=Bovine papular stomatitis virus TaxID=129727 RepID=Q6TVD2_9POXV|nr:ORF056 RNA polymerase subunit RPO147 [Bovine papular stomatitis virus]AAR98413.1 ORF056 RNA polymerase subunit RPO147 [Bovine papular stomatitis virus]
MSIVHRVSYSLYSQSEISATDVVISQMKNEDDLGTVKDPRLGASDGSICRTCGLTEMECFGHWGKTRIYESYIVRPEYISEVMRLLNHLCIRCGLLRSRDPYTTDVTTLSVHEMRKMKDRMMSKKKACWNSKCLQPYQKIVFSKKKICFVNKIDEIPVPNALIYQKLTSIHRKFWPLLEVYQDPANLFYREYIPIPPLLIRPAISFWIDNIPKETNELTYLLGMIVKYCSMNAEEQVIQRAMIEYDNIKIISSNSSSINLSYIISGKSNMLRSFVVARRKDQTARSVIGPDSSLSVREVGIPDYIRNTLTQKVFVNYLTSKRVRALFEERSVKFYFNKRLRQLTRIKDGKFIKDKIHLLPGDWVEIAMTEGTNVIFGRQPSLHRHNVISSTARASLGYTIKIPPGIANSQNADFDGDEEWMVLEQNPKSVIEQSVLMYPVTIFKHDAHGAPVYGSIQDEIVAAYSLFRERDLTLDEVLNLLGRYGRDFTPEPGKTKFSGGDIFRFMISADINYRGILEDGRVVAANVDSDLVVAMRATSLAGLIADYSTNVQGVRFVDTLSYVLKRYLAIYGFGVTFRDLRPDASLVNRLHALNTEKIEQIKDAYARYLQDVAEGRIVPMSPADEADAVESLLSNLTNLNVREINEYMRETLENNPDNNLLKMARAGYKVNPTELMYLLGTYGQQRVDGAVAETKVYGRVLPYALPNSADPEARGYIINSLMNGLSGSQFYFAMLVARSQSTDIVCETSRTGTLARKVIKKMEDTVVDGYGQVVSGSVLLKYAANYAKIPGSTTKPVELIFPDEKMTWFLEISAIWDRIRHGFVRMHRQRMATKILAPFNFLVFVKPAPSAEAAISPRDLYHMIRRVMDDVREKYFFTLASTDFMEYVFLTHLNPSRVRITRETATLIFRKLYHKLNALLGGGTPVGIMSAQVLCEKFTQQALSSFHTTEKSGGVKVKLGFNEFSNLITMSRNHTEIVSLTSADINKLMPLKINFEFVCLGELLPEISAEPSGRPSIYRVRVRIHRLRIKRAHLTEVLVDSIIERFVSFNVLVKEWGSDMTVDGDHVEYTLLLRFVEPEQLNFHKFMLVLPGAANKGKVSKFKIPITECAVHDDHNATRKAFRMNIELMSLKELGIFDLEDVNVVPGMWNTFDIFGIEAARGHLCESMLDTYGVGFDYLFPSCDLLASLLCAGYEPESVNKFKFWNASALKKATFGDGRALLNAALHNRTDTVADNSSCHFFSKTPGVGTGYYKYFVNVEMFMRMEKEIQARVAERKMGELEEAAEEEF